MASPAPPAGPADIDEWHRQVVEEPLEPGLPIVDAHHHLWDARPGVRPEKADLATVLHFGHRNHLAKVFQAPELQNTGHNIVKTVFLEAGQKYDTTGDKAMRPVGEVRHMQGVADATAQSATHVNAAIIGHADLLLGAGVEPVLRAMMQYPNFRGIRHSASGLWDKDGTPSAVVRTNNARGPEHLYMNAAFREGFAVLGRLGLSFDAWCYHTQIDEVADLARAFPATQIVLDHIGGPLGVGPFAGRQLEVRQEWKAAMARLAACPNVAVKLGGIMPINGFGFELRAKPPTSEEVADVVGPYYRHCIELFGASRCMFESNFAVDRACVSYVVLWNAFKRLSAGYSDAARAALFAGTAARVYRLGPPPASKM